MSSAWALASAEARAATDSLDRGIRRLRHQDLEAHGARFRALCSYAMPDRLLGVLRHQSLELTFRPLVIEKGLSGIAEEPGKLRPGIRRAQLDVAECLDSWPRCLGIDQMGRLAGLDAAPELLFRLDQYA